MKRVFLNDVLKYLILFLAMLSALKSAEAQVPATGSVGMTVKNAGAGSATRWLAPEAGRVLGFDSNGQLKVVPAGGTVTWGELEGALANQADLQAVLDSKASLSGPEFEGFVKIPAGAEIEGYLTEAMAMDLYQPKDGDLSLLADVSTSPYGRGLLVLGSRLALTQEVLLMVNATAGVGLFAETGVPDAAAWRQHLNLVVGTDVQPFSAELGSLAGLEPFKGRLLVGNGTAWEVLEPGANDDMLLADDVRFLGVRWGQPANFMMRSTYDPQGAGRVSGQGIVAPGGVLNLDAGGTSNATTAAPGGSVLTSGGAPANMDEFSGVHGGSGGTLDMRGEDAPDPVNRGRAAGSLSTRGTGSLGLGYEGTRTTVKGAAVADWTLTLPSGPGVAGQVLKTTGAGVTEWSALEAGGSVTSVAASGGTTGLSVSGSPVTASGTLTLGGTLALGHGGTGATTAMAARGNLGLGTGDSPVFRAINLQTTDNTFAELTLSSAISGTSVLSIENLSGTRVHQLPDASGTLALVEQLGAYQPLDGDLTSLAALSTTTYGRALLTQVDSSSARSALEVVIGTHVQAYDADLADLADGSLTGSKIGSGINATNITSGTLPVARMPAFIGDVTTSSGAATTALSTTGVTAGTYPLAQVTVDTKGRITQASQGSAVQVDVYDGALLTDNTTMTATWTKPAGAKVIEVLMIGGGGGGGSGRQGAGSTVRYGGGGGAGGARVHLLCQAAEVAANVSIEYGARIQGGVRVLASSTNGNQGGTGISSAFGPYRAQGGNGGNGGTTAVGTSQGGGAFSSSCLAISASSNNLAGGAAGSASPVAGEGGSGLLPTGGGGGAGITSTNGQGFGEVGGGSSGVTTVAGATAGANGVSVGLVGFGGGGGNGGTNAGSLPQDGGDGGNYGAGGGGGGGSVNGVASGKGGRGGAGIVIIRTYF